MILTHNTFHSVARSRRTEHTRLSMRRLSASSSRDQYGSLNRANGNWFGRSVCGASISPTWAVSLSRATILNRIFVYSICASDLK